MGKFGKLITITYVGTKHNSKINQPLGSGDNSIYHILNGDCLAQQLAYSNVRGEFIICRESLIVGPVFANDEASFWDVRSTYFSDIYGVTDVEYRHKTVSEFEIIKNIPPGSTVCLWFEHDLFCQVNMWFVISHLSIIPNLRLYRIFPINHNNQELWSGFGSSTVDDLEQAFALRIKFSASDIELTNDMWLAYRNGDLSLLKDLSATKSTCFEYLEAVCQAQIDRFPEEGKPNRPEMALLEIMKTKPIDFAQLFSAFSAKEGIYGFGDTQIKEMMNKLGIKSFEN